MMIVEINLYLNFLFLSRKAEDIFIFILYFIDKELS